MLLGFLSPFSRSRSFPLLLQSSRPGTIFASDTGRMLQMDHQNSNLIAQRKPSNFRVCNVSGYKTDLLEIRAENPTLHILFVPGNPGVISFYTDFLESLYELLGGAASITAIAQTSHTKKNWQHGRLFSLEEQIDHKANFINRELKNIEVPIVLPKRNRREMDRTAVSRRTTIVVAGSSSVDDSEAEVDDDRSHTPLVVTYLSKYSEDFRERSPFLSATVSSILALLGLLPAQATRLLLKNSIGKSWSSTAVDALCNNLLQYHTMQNVLYMARTEFIKLLETPDWAYLREKQSRIAFLFGDADHWGPLRMFEEISKQVPNAVLAIEREGHSHAFSCTEAGSLWVAKYVANLIKNQIPR